MFSVVRVVVAVSCCLFAVVTTDVVGNFKEEHDNTTIQDECGQQQSQALISTLLTVSSTSNTNEHVHRDLILRSEYIPSRRQWDCNYRMLKCCTTSCTNAICDGYCGETTIQESLLYYGSYVSQGLIRRIVKFNDNNNAREVIIDTDQPKVKPDLLITAELLGLAGDAWYAPIINKKGMNRFIKWTNGHLENDTPVAMGILMKGSFPNTYDHIVTTVAVVSNGLQFNDHYSNTTKTMTTNTLPRSGTRCSYEYCFSNYMNGVALLQPPDVDKGRLVRLQVTNEPYQEPNWTCGLTVYKMLTLAATAAYPQLLDNNQNWFVAVTYRGSTSSDIRNGDLFTGSPLECYALSNVSAITIIEVQSDEAVYTSIVSDQEGCTI